MATPTAIQSVTVALRAGVSEATLPNNVKMRSGINYAISLRDWSKISTGARNTVIAAPTFNTSTFIVPLWNAAGYVLDLDTINNKSTIALVNSDTQAVKDFALGDVVEGFDGSVFKLVLVSSGSATVAAGSSVVWGGASTAVTSAAAKKLSTVTSDVSDVTVQDFAGVAIGTITAGNYGWIQTEGIAYAAKVAATVDAGAPVMLSSVDETLINAENEVVTLTLTSWDSTDTIKLTYAAVETGAITYSATPATNAAAFQAALIALAAFAPGDVVVTATNINVYVFTFGGAFANTDVSAITATSGTGSAAGTFVETNKGAGGFGSVIGTAMTAADTGTANVEIRSRLFANRHRHGARLFLDKN